MKKINYPLKINKGKRFLIKGSISFSRYAFLKDADQLKKDKAYL